MAWAEARLILSNLLWHFDVRQEGKFRNWEDQEVYLLWQKEPLMVGLKRAAKA